MALESTQNQSELEQYAVLEDQELDSFFSSARQSAGEMGCSHARVPDMGEESSVRPKDSGKERRKKRRLRNEPQSVVGECIFVSAVW